MQNAARTVWVNKTRPVKRIRSFFVEREVLVNVTLIMRLEVVTVVRGGGGGNMTLILTLCLTYYTLHVHLDQ